MKNQKEKLCTLLFILIVIAIASSCRTICPAYPSFTKHQRELNRRQ